MLPGCKPEAEHNQQEETAGQRVEHVGGCARRHWIPQARLCRKALHAPPGELLTSRFPGPQVPRSTGWGPAVLLSGSAFGTKALKVVYGAGRKQGPGERVSCLQATLSLPLSSKGSQTLVLIFPLPARPLLPPPARRPLLADPLWLRRPLLRAHPPLRPVGKAVNRMSRQAGSVGVVAPKCL